MTPENATQHKEREHSKISPSKLKNLEISPRWIPDEKEDEHPVTAEGTLMHEALDSGESGKLNDDQRKLVEMCKDYVDAVQQGEQMWIKFPEIRLDILGGIWGYADLVLITPDHRRAHLIDYKFSFKRQEPVETNPAAQAYVYGLFQTFPALQEIGVHYLYPRLEEVDTCWYGPSHVTSILIRLKTIVERVQTATTCTPTHETCLYCGRKATCAELHRMALPVATRYAERKEMELPPEYDPALIKEPAQMARALTIAAVMEKWADSVKMHALEMRQSGTEIPGYELRHREGKPKILNPEIAYLVAESQGVTHQQFMSCTTVSAAQLRDIAGENAPRGQKGKKSQALVNALADAGVWEDGSESYYLVREKGEKKLATVEAA